MHEVIFYLVRHGKTVFNTLEKVQGWADSPLTAEGKEVVEHLGKGLKDIDFDAAYSSDSGRARETLSTILKSKSQYLESIEEKKNLREVCFGKYEGGLDEDMFSYVVSCIGVETEDFHDIDVPTFLSVIKKSDSLDIAEDYETVLNRMLFEINKIADYHASNGGGNILVVSHGLALGILLSKMKGEQVSDLNNASVSKVRYANGSFTVENINDTSFIEKGKSMIG